MFTHFYSDPHFGHANIIKYACRPFESVNRMDHRLEELYMHEVNNDDHVLWLGDCFWKKDFEKWKKLLARLPGRKTLIRGNHDYAREQMLELGFEAVYERATFTIAGVPVLACHYPPQKARYTGQSYDVKYDARRPQAPAGGFVMHGHTHERLQVTLDRIHVGVDAWNYRPATLKEVENLIPFAVELPWDKTPVTNPGEDNGNS